jgi:transposase
MVTRRGGSLQHGRDPDARRRGWQATEPRAPNLSSERTRIINRVKGALIRLRIRNFNPKLRNAAERLAQLQTPEGVPLPPNTLAEFGRDLARLRLIADQARAIEKTRLDPLQRTPDDRPHAMLILLARVIGVGVETADMLGHEVLSRGSRDRRAVARYADLTGSPDESGAKRREKGLAKAGNSRVRRGMLQLAWRWLMFQKTSALAQWHRVRTENAPPRARKTMIIALARKLPIRSFAADAHGCIMVAGPDGPTEYKVAAR